MPDNASLASMQLDCNRMKLPVKMMIVKSHEPKNEDEISVSAGDGVIVLDCSKNENYLVFKPSSGLFAKRFWGVFCK